MNKVLLSSLAVLLLGSCNESKDRFMEQAKKETSESLQISESDIKITLNDYLEEAGSIQAEAREIITRAEEINCSEAKKLAENVLLITKKAKEQNTLFRVEHFIEQASQTLADAEDAIIYCEEKNEISYATGINDDEK